MVGPQSVEAEYLREKLQLKFSNVFLRMFGKVLRVGSSGDVWTCWNTLGVVIYGRLLLPER